MANQGYASFLAPGEAVDPTAAQTFMVRMLTGKMATATLVEVISCTNSGGLSPVGFVDVQPLVNQVDGNGVPVPHGVIHNLPYFRLQGGANAVIIDPQRGDIGMAAFASRDISSVKANRAQANPGSARRFDMADGMYFGGLLNGAPTQYVQFSAAGITITSPTAITLNAPTITANASTSFTVNAPQSTFSAKVTINGLLTFVAGIVGSAAAGAAAVITGTINFIGALTSNGKNISDSHTHSDPQGGNTGGVN